ncbi:hypothetical protein [Halomarina oriensis]|uniref:Uncharacterized protein n=1 Tax=Halomarina oriensis TaxID=671145 RepID=A0A6B0GVV1_9EURY|nr:hypothetical protein [Halomarina oriensis]MWG35838.1 hypothetical protein [Halomarina oriensis]
MILNVMEEQGWIPLFEQSRYRTVDEREYAVITFDNKRSLVNQEAYLLWLGNPSDEVDFHAVGYRFEEVSGGPSLQLSSSSDGSVTTTRVVSGDVTQETSTLVREPGVGTDAATGGGPGGCCSVPISDCPFLDQNWNCFVDIIGWALQIPAFLVGCAACAATLGTATFGCLACVGSLLRQGGPLNLPCDDGFYNNCEVTGRMCVPEDYEYRYKVCAVG